MTAPADTTPTDNTPTASGAYAYAFAAQRAALAEVVAIPVTPFAADGSVDEETFEALLRRLLDGGVRTLTPNGNTGEFYALTLQERFRAAELTLDVVGGRAAVLVGVGHDVPTAVDAARHARDHGARMVMVHQPVHPYVSEAGWVDYHRAIADAVPELGVVPYVKNAALPGARLAELGAACPNVIGVKYAVPDAARFAAFARDAGLDRFVWVAGLAEPYAPSYFSAGATGFTSGLVNVVPGISLSMIEALRSGDYPAAMKVWERIRRFEELRGADASANNVTVVKEALASLGLCRRAVRPPSKELPEPQRAEVAAIAAGWSM
ncbi:dihydrodipicolinate synthase family protein [Streptomyces beihaiensis]|uniref:Dihydrodipicolinate synthase family protein n=1 Tax=Streptomyces beihaiensis TaxID=2984495 RepID=A0ABT3TPK8_9ACTN|nr:dihydrodipicolinate synthase family protein [Streptomyces beihaiensis]MCX3058970.1 dihydrodipicolinate synthase family protein [Streptomyces beihaiensis]